MFTCCTFSLTIEILFSHATPLHFRASTYLPFENLFSDRAASSTISMLSNISTSVYAST
jgi:hypothetical protein